MLKVLIPNNPEFKTYENEIKTLYEINQDKINDINDFDFVKNETFFYAFILNEKPLGGIYYYEKNGKLFVNAFARRKNLKEKLFCLKTTLSWFTCDIYAVAENRASVFCLLWLGFERVNGRLFVYKRPEGTKIQRQ